MFKRTLFLLLTLALLCARPLAVRGEVIVEAKLDTAEILIGQQVTLRLQVTTTGGQRVSFPDYDPQQELVPGVEVVSSPAADTTRLGDGARRRIERRYVLTSFDAARYRLRPAVVVDGDTVACRQAVELKVNTVKVDTANTDKFYGPHGPVDAPFTWSGRLLWPALVLVALCVAVVRLLKRLRDRRPRTRRVVIPPKEPAHRKALAAMEKVRTMPRTDRAEAKAYYMKLTDVLRAYIGERFGINAREMTSSEIVDALLHVGDATALRELREVFETADLVKFAKHEATLPEADRSLLQAVDFVNTTKPDEVQAPQPTVEIVTVGEERQRRVRRCLTALCIVLSVAAVALAAWLTYELVVTFA